MKVYDESVPVNLREEQIFILRDIVMYLFPMCTMKNDLISELAHGMLLFGSKHSLRIKREGSNWDEYEKENQQLALWLKELLTLREKNSPKKPYMESDGEADGYPVWDYYCPSCNEYFDEYEPKYCWECGQAIDWSEENNCPTEECVNK